jgi:hypothetical protein
MRVCVRTRCLSATQAVFSRPVIALGSDFGSRQLPQEQVRVRACGPRMAHTPMALPWHTAAA